MEIRETQEMLLALMPHWNYRIAKPFKQMLDSGVSLEMYYCIQTLRWYGGSLTMSELAGIVKMPKQQMTKMVNRLVECQFVKRMYDLADRRVIRIQLTENALNYINHFLEQDAGCFRDLLEEMSPSDRERFSEAIRTIADVFAKMPHDIQTILSEAKKQIRPDSPPNAHLSCK